MKSIPSKENQHGFERDLDFCQKAVSAEISRFFKAAGKRLSPFSKNALVKEEISLMESYCKRKGKRIRPALTMMTYRALTGKDPLNVVREAVALELFHNHTLVHDDIYDEDDLRRREKAVHVLLREWCESRYPGVSRKTRIYKDSSVRFGAVAGFIGGKMLHLMPFLAVLNSGISDRKKLEMFRLLFEVSFIDNVGQAEDLAFEYAPETKEKEYLEMVRHKTMNLLRISVRLGLLLGGAKPSQSKAFLEYIENIGEAFQIKDDLIDIDPQSDKGRAVGSDIREGKKTMLIIHALENASPAEKKVILSALGRRDIGKNKIMEVIGMMRRLGSVDYCTRECRRRISRARKALERIRGSLDPRAYAFFVDLAEFILSRKK